MDFSFHFFGLNCTNFWWRALDFGYPDFLSCLLTLNSLSLSLSPFLTTRLLTPKIPVVCWLLFGKLWKLALENVVSSNEMFKNWGMSSESPLVKKYWWPFVLGIIKKNDDEDWILTVLYYYKLLIRSPFTAISKRKKNNMGLWYLVYLIFFSSASFFLCSFSWPLLTTISIFPAAHSHSTYSFINKIKFSHISNKR